MNGFRTNVLLAADNEHLTLGGVLVTGPSNGELWAPSQKHEHATLTVTGTHVC